MEALLEGLPRSWGVPGQTHKKFASEGFCMEISTPQKPLLRSLVGDRQPRTIPTKDLLHQVVLWGGVVCGFSEPKKKAKYAPPPVLHCDVDRQFCGGGAWISGSDLGPLPGTSLRTPPPELLRSPSMSSSSREAGWRTVLTCFCLKRCLGQTLE